MTGAPPGGVIDSHVHLWSPEMAFHAWPGTDLAAIHRAFDLDDLARCAPAVTGVVLVQAQPDVRETGWLLDIAARDDRVLGVVGWVAMDAPDAVAQIGQLAGDPRLVGLRPMLQDIADPDWILRDAVQPALAAMVRHGLAFDALIRPEHLGVIYDLATRWPELRIIVDHGAKPAIEVDGDAGWRQGIADLGQLPNLWCKLSGLRTEQATGADPADVVPYARHLLRSFPGRVLWGSDWPVLLLSGDDHADWLDLAHDIVLAEAPTQVSSVFRDAARNVYRRRRVTASAAG